MNDIIVVIPTYNERQTLPLLVEKIFLLKIPNLKIIIVDDNSPDGTGELADQLASKYNVYVIHRSGKQGLGTAYKEAYDYILVNSPDLDAVIQMDADLSHDPEVIPLFLEKIRTCDLVLGSRYVSEGQIKNWNFLRKTVSSWGNVYARNVLSLPYKDLTSGFKCYRGSVLSNLNWSEVASLGYNFQIETTYRAHKAGFKIIEMPIVFTERKAGLSKFNLGIILESFWKVLKLRFR